MIRVLQGVHPEKILFVDIETAAGQKELTEESPFFDAWEYKNRNSKEFDKKGFTEDLLQSYQEKAALYAEFGRIICISCGYIKDGELRCKSFYGTDEEQIIKDFYAVLDKLESNWKSIKIAGHAIKVFDIPYIFKRSIILGLSPHRLMDTSGVKPWELDSYVIDSKDLFQGTSFTPSSLIALAAAFGLPNPKQDIAGNETSEAYYNEEYDRIAQYCERDVLTSCNIVRKFMGLVAIDKVPSELDLKGLPLLERIAVTGNFTEADLQSIENTLPSLEEDEKIIAMELLQAAFTKSGMPENIEKLLA